MDANCYTGGKCQMSNMAEFSETTHTNTGSCHVGDTQCVVYHSGSNL